MDRVVSVELFHYHLFDNRAIQIYEVSIVGLRTVIVAQLFGEGIRQRRFLV